MGFLSSIYFPIFMIITIMAFLNLVNSSKQLINLNSIFCVIILGLLAGLRVESPDQVSYAKIFTEAPSLVNLYHDINKGNYDSTEYQWGFLFLFSTIKVLTNNETVMFLLLAFINVGLVAFSSVKLSPYPLLSIFIYYSWFYYSNLGALRHATLHSFLLITIVFIVYSKTLKSILLLLYTISLHKVGLFALSVYLVNKTRPQIFSYTIALFLVLIIR